VAAIAPDLRWDFPLRLLGGLHRLVLDGRASWEQVDRAVDEHAEFLREFAATRTVQTNEVARAWALLPGLLSIGVERVDLIELGASAGLLLALDDYDYVYRAGSWGRGTGELVLAGEDRGGPPASLLERRLSIGQRLGVDLNPVFGQDVKLLEAFVWPDQDGRMERLRRAAAVTRRREPKLVRGDYVEALPALLAARRDDVLTVVMSSVTTIYLDDERYAELVAAFAAGGESAWLSLEVPRGEPDYDGMRLELTTWPAGDRRLLAEHVDYHALSMGWLG
jgi:hypothetical protein